LLTEVCCSVFISNANEIDQQSIRIGSKWIRLTKNLNWTQSEFESSEVHREPPLLPF
jgi:hypothetical protein